MTNGAQTTGGSEFIDRKAGLVAFGIMQILFGIFCLLMVPLITFGMYASSLRAGSAAPMNAQMMIPSVLVYVVLAIWAIWMGIGSIQARRWARALLLVTSWFWLISGILGLVFVLLFLPSIYDQMGKTGQMPQQIANVMKYVMTGFMVVFYIIIPGAFVLFYGSRNVKATCERRNPHVCWTDKCPLPVLAVSLMTGLWCVFLPMMGIYGWPIPFFGTILTGIMGAGVSIALIVLLGYVALGFYKLNIRAWWFAIMMAITWGVSSGITFSRVSMMDFYEKMNFPAQQLEMMKQVAGAMDPLMAPFCVLWVVIALAYLFYIKKYLLQSEGSTSTVLPENVDAVSPPPVPFPPQTGASSGGLAIASLVLGIMAVLLGIFVLGGLFGLLGLILGVIHLVRSRSHRSFAIWGVVLSIIGCLMAVVILSFGFLMLSK